MPFKSEKQRRFLWAEHPEIAKRWAREYPESNKGLPMRVEKSDSKEKAAALAVLGDALAKHAVTLTTAKLTSVSVINDDGTIKKSNDGLVRVELPKTEGPTYAGQEQEAGGETSCQKALAPNSEKALDLNNPVAAKLATVLSRALREQLENSNAQAEGRDPLPVPRNMGIKRYAIAPQLHQLPMGMQPQAPAQGQAPPSNGPVGGGNNPTANPIQAFGPLSASGQLNGNAAFGVKNSPDSSKTAASAAWTRAEGKSESGGLNAKGRASLKAQGHDIKAPVTESNPSGERAKRQNSFCSRMCGMKKHETGAKTKSDPDSRINKSLRKWNCKCSSAYEFGKAASQAASRVSPDLLSGLRQLGQGMRTAGRESAQLARMNLPTLAPKTTELLKGTQAAPRSSFGTLSALAPLLRRLAPAR